MPTECTIRVQICPASAMAAVASGENVAAKGFIPISLKLVEETAGKKI